MSDPTQAVLDEATTAALLVSPPDGIIMLIEPGTSKVAIPAFQFDEHSRPKPRIQEINRLIGVRSLDLRSGRDGMHWWTQFAVTLDANTHRSPAVKPISVIDDPQRLKALLKYMKSWTDNESY